jgi:hypothetical protein
MDKELSVEVFMIQLSLRTPDGNKTESPRLKKPTALQLSLSIISVVANVTA